RGSNGSGGKAPCRLPTQRKNTGNPAMTSTPATMAMAKAHLKRGWAMAVRQSGRGIIAVQSSANAPSAAVSTLAPGNHAAPGPLHPHAAAPAVLAYGDRPGAAHPGRLLLRRLLRARRSFPDDRGCPELGGWPRL